jgi:LPXTG-site transpeptidase (sortase) family protein
LGRWSPDFLRAVKFMQVHRTSAVRKPLRFRLNRSQFVLKPDLWRPFPKIKKSELSHSRLRSSRRTVGCVLVVVGTLLCTYVAGTYVWMYAQQKILLRRWNEHTANPLLVKLAIPRIHLEDVVLEGASNHSLLLGPAHLSETPEPGDIGNSVIAGHRDTFFRHIHSLRYGDDIYVLRSGKRYHYVVRARRVVEPTNLAVLNPSKDGELTLITCWPTHAIGPAPQRLIVVAKMVTEPDMALSQRPVGARVPFLLK